MRGAKPPFPHVSSCRSAQLNTGMSLCLPPAHPQTVHTYPCQRYIHSYITCCEGCANINCTPPRTSLIPLCRISYRQTELCKVTFQDLIHLCMVTPYAWKIRSLIDLHFWCSGCLFFFFFNSISCTFLPSVLQLTLRRFSSAATLLYYHSQYSRFKIEGHSAKI